MSDRALDRILDNIFPTETDIEITEEIVMSDSQRIALLNMLVTDLITSFSTLAQEVQALKEEVKNDRDEKRSK